jgi:hypothetical protein
VILPRIIGGFTVLCWAWAVFSVVYSYTQSVGLLGWGISLSQGRYLHTGQHKHKKSSQAFMPQLGLESMTPAFEQQKEVYASERAASVMGVLALT